MKSLSPMGGRIYRLSCHVLEINRYHHWNHVTKIIGALATLLLLVLTACNQDAEHQQVRTLPNDPSVAVVDASASVIIKETSEADLGSIRNVTILPSVIIANKGDQVVLDAKAFLDLKSTDDDVEYIWAVTDPRSGRVSTAGVFTAGKRVGVYENAVSVTALRKTSEGPVYKDAKATVHIVGESQEVRLAQVEIFPSNPIVRADQIYRMRAVGYDEHGVVVPGVKFVWRILEPAVGYVNEVGYITVSAHEGDYPKALEVTGLWNEVEYKAFTGITVMKRDKRDQYVSVQALPQRFYIDQGSVIQLRAVTLNGLGELIAGTELRWNMTDSAAGTIDSNGNFVAGGTPGVFAEAVRVEAVLPGEHGIVKAEDYASVVVRKSKDPDRLKRVKAVPGSVTLAPNKKIVLAGVALDVLGRPVHDVVMNWELSNGSAGTIDNLGVFTSGDVPGIYEDAIKLSAFQQLEDDGITESATLDVAITGVLNEAEIQPKVATIRPRTAFHFSIVAVDQNGLRIPNILVRWSLSDENIGSIDHLGNFVAGDNAGYYKDAIKATVIQLDSR